MSKSHRDSVPLTRWGHPRCKSRPWWSWREALASAERRGVPIDSRWRTFANFWEDSPGWWDGCALRCIDRAGPFACGNYQWAAKADASAHPPHRMPDGRRAVDVARLNGLTANAFHQRCLLGLPVARAAITPPFTREDRAHHLRTYSHMKGQRPGDRVNRQNYARRLADGFRIVERMSRRLPATDRAKVLVSGWSAPDRRWLFLDTEQVRRDLRDLI